jgi:predicted  nucleic acid-binding Zn-ribbon protein
LEETAQRLDQDLDRLADRVGDAEARLDVAEQDITAINEELDDHENRIEALETGQQIADEVNVRLTTLEEVADITLTQDQIATEREIRNLFENDREGD